MNLIVIKTNAIIILPDRVASVDVLHLGLYIFYLTPRSSYSLIHRYLKILTEKFNFKFCACNKK